MRKKTLFTILTLLLMSLPGCHNKEQKCDGQVLYFVREQDKGARTEQGVEVTVKIQLLNLPKDYRQNPPVKPGDTWWLRTGKGSLRARVRSVAVQESPYPALGRLSVKLRTEGPVTKRITLISRCPIGEQTWTAKKPRDDTMPYRVVVTTEQGLFRLDSDEVVPEGGYPEGDGPSQVRVDVYEKKTGEQKWKKRTSFMTNSPAEPYLDVDGDGVPEITSIEWYRETILRRFYPKVEVIAVDASGT